MIGICIRYFHRNYGGMLQAFATTKIFEKRGFDYELVRYEKKMGFVWAIKSIPRIFNSVWRKDNFEGFKKRVVIKMHPEIAIKDAIRAAAFDRFKEKNFTKLSPVYKIYSQLCKAAKKYSIVVSGSDQIWSPAALPTKFYNLMFVPDNIKKVSYASSFGVKEIPWYQKKRTTHFLNRIEFVSTRELTGSNIVEKLTGRKVPTVLDPVFMFDYDEWKELVPYEKEIEEPYIFAYFLGINKEHRDAVNELAKKTGLKIVTLRHLDEYFESDEEFGDYAPYDIDPGQFLNILRNAEYVCTDSFHGTCFSIINNRKFMVFNRYLETTKNSKNSRIDSLCTMLDLHNRRFNGDNIMSVTDDIDYDFVYKKLDALKKEANEYLDKALNG